MENETRRIMKNEKIGTSGATQPAGKSSAPDAVLRKGLQPKSESVRDAVEVSGAARHACDVQLRRDQIVGTSSSGKKRPAAIWGIDEN
jgi:hypothetical protein